MVHTLNAALCEFHIKNCPPSQQLKEACDKAAALYAATRNAVQEMDLEMSCMDAVVRHDWQVPGMSACAYCCGAAALLQLHDELCKCS